MKKLAKWLSILSINVFVIAWTIGGFMIFNGNFENNVWAYAGLVSFALFFICILYMKFTNRCPHCGKINPSFGKYCPFCGKEIK